MWEYCNEPNVCSKVTHIDPVDGEEPTGIVTKDGVVAGIVIDVLSTNSSAPFLAFKDNLTAECGVYGDCTYMLWYEVEKYKCADCPDDCDNYDVC